MCRVHPRICSQPSQFLRPPSRIPNVSARNLSSLHPRIPRGGAALLEGSSPLSFSDPRAGIHSSPPTPFNPVIPRLREESGGKRSLHHSGSRRPEAIPRGGAAHPEQSRRVERGAPHCQTTPPAVIPAEQEPIPPEGAPPAEPGPLHPFLPRHSGRREPESITGGGQGGASCPLSLRWERARVKVIPLGKK